MANLSNQPSQTVLPQDTHANFDRFTVLQDAPESDLSAKTYFAEELVPDGNMAAITSAIDEIVGIRNEHHLSANGWRIPFDPTSITLERAALKMQLATDALHSASATQLDSAHASAGAVAAHATADGNAAGAATQYARVHIPFNDADASNEPPDGNTSGGGTDPVDPDTNPGTNPGGTDPGTNPGTNPGSGTNNPGTNPGGNNNGGNPGSGEPVHGSDGSNPIIDLDLGLNLLGDPGAPLLDLGLGIDLSGDTLLDLDTTIDTILDTDIDLSANIDSLLGGIDLVTDVTSNLPDLLGGVQNLVNHLVTPDAPCDDGTASAIITLNLDTANLTNPVELLNGLITINPDGNQLLDANLGIATIAGTVIDLQAETTSLAEGLLDLGGHADVPILDSVTDLLGGVLTSSVSTPLGDGLLGGLFSPQEPCADDSASGGAIIDLQLDANLLANPGALLDGALTIDLSGDSLLNLDVGVDTLLDTSLDLDGTLDHLGLDLGAVLDTGLLGGGNADGASPVDAWTSQVENTVTETISTVTQTLNTVLPVIPTAIIPETILPKIKPFKLF